jgi:membrane protease YdiL (CAAX protease family)
MSDTAPVTPQPTAEAPLPPMTPPSWPRKLLSVFWNAEERRIRALWRLIALIAVVIGSGLAIRATGLLPERGTPEFFLVGTVLRLVLGLLTVWLVGWLVDRRPFRDFGFSMNRAWWADLAFGLGLGAALMTGIFLVEWALGWVEVTGTFRTPVEGEVFALAILMPVVLFVGVGILEELLARGYLLRNVAEGLAFRRLGGARGGLIIACVISSALFAQGHADNPNATWVSTANIAIAGVLLALGFMLTGQLALPIGLHITWNFFQASVFGFPVSGVSRMRTTFVATEQVGPEMWTGGAFGPEAGLVGLGAMIVGVVLTLLWVRWRQGEVRLATALAEPPPPRMPRSARTA